MKLSRMVKKPPLVKSIFSEKGGFFKRYSTDHVKSLSFTPLVFPGFSTRGGVKLKTQVRSTGGSPRRGVENFGILNMGNAGFPLQKSYFKCKIPDFFRLRRYFERRNFVLMLKNSDFFSPAALLQPTLVTVMLRWCSLFHDILSFYQ